MSANPTLAHGVVGRADLLRSLAVAPRHHLVLDTDASGWFGYERQDEARPLALSVEAHQQELPSRSQPDLDSRLPLQMPFAWVMADRQKREPRERATDMSPDITSVTPLDDDDIKPRSCVRLIDYEDLVPQARILPALRRYLGAMRIGSLDIDELAACLASMRVPRRLPRRQYRRWHPDLVVVLDFCPRLWPYRMDMHRLAERLLRLCGRRNLSLRIINHGPMGTWSDWSANQNPLAALPPEHAWKMPIAGAPVLIVSDLGLIAGKGSPATQAWLTFINQLQQAKVEPLALAPIGAGQLDSDLARMVPVVRWSADAAAKPERGQAVEQGDPAGLDDLLAMVAAARRVDPPLLRAMRRLNPAAPLDAGLEGAVWCHDDVEPGFAISVRRDQQNKHLKRFSERLRSLHAELDALRRHHHAHFPMPFAHEEMLLWAAHAPEAVESVAEAKRWVSDALAFMGKLAESLAEPGNVPLPAGDLLAVAEGILRRADGTMGRRYARVLTRLAVQARVHSGDAAVPGWIDPAELAKALPSAPAIEAWIVQDLVKGHLCLQTEPADLHQLPISPSLGVDGGGVHLNLPETGYERWYPAETLPAVLATTDKPTTLVVETTADTITVAAAGRPRGAAAWSQDASGLTVEIPPFVGGVRKRLTSSDLGIRQPESSHRWTMTSDSVSISDGPFEVTFNIVGDFGVTAFLTVSTQHGRAGQRFRWIEPGSFMMGSPDDEPGRFAGEGPRHLVTLTSGFWLGSTACSQAFWQAVMGENPSHFKGTERPAEQVSWNDVQVFLRKLEALLPDCRADLPTEAEWEYACRAGTATAYSFGDSISKDQANVASNETIDVSKLPANPWGFHEMHGNVWEWCADGAREYTASAEVDPRGPGGPEALRAFRGGSWAYGSRGARSASRLAFHPGTAYVSLGFRLCLRSIEPSQGRPGGPAGAPPRDEAESANTKSIAARLMDLISPSKWNRRG